MFCGIDVYHEAGRRTSSIIAFIASIDKNATKWTSDTATHNPGQEISNVIPCLFRDCLYEWHKVNLSFR